MSRMARYIWREPAATWYFDELNLVLLKISYRFVMPPYFKSIAHDYFVAPTLFHEIVRRFAFSLTSIFAWSLPLNIMREAARMRRISFGAWARGEALIMAIEAITLYRGHEKCGGRPTPATIDWYVIPRWFLSASSIEEHLISALQTFSLGVKYTLWKSSWREMPIKFDQCRPYEEAICRTRWADALWAKTRGSRYMW